MTTDCHGTLGGAQLTTTSAGGFKYANTATPACTNVNTANTMAVNAWTRDHVVSLPDPVDVATSYLRMESEIDPTACAVFLERRSSTSRRLRTRPSVRLTLATAARAVASAVVRADFVSVMFSYARSNRFFASGVICVMGQILPTAEMCVNLACRIGDITEFPPDLHVREYPRLRTAA